MKVMHKCAATLTAAIIATTAAAVAVATPAQALPDDNCTVLSIQENLAWNLYTFWDGLATTADGYAALGDELTAESYFTEYERAVRMEMAFHC
jgi:hypothetical protein